MGGIFQRRCSADHDDAAPKTGLVEDNKYIKLRFEVERKTDRQDGKQLVLTSHLPFRFDVEKWIKSEQIMA